MNWLLGSDPELMLIDASGNLRSAIGVIDGTKERPLQLEDGMAQHDNVNAEFGITPAKNEDEWVNRHRNVLVQLDSLIGDSLKLAVIASADFPESELNCEAARKFACDPDFNPYSVDVNTIPEGAADGTLRSCGGHIHFGSDMFKKFDDILEGVKVMDIFLGIPSLLLDKDPTSTRRRELYGCAGAHRPKSYGFEYRPLGNFWISNPHLTALVWKLSRDGIEAFANGHVSGINKNAIRATIDAGRLDKAEEAMKGFIIPLLGEDTKELMDRCLQLPHSNIYESWEI